ESWRRWKRGRCFCCTVGVRAVRSHGCSQGLFVVGVQRVVLVWVTGLVGVHTVIWHPSVCHKMLSAGRERYSQADAGEDDGEGKCTGKRRVDERLMGRKRE
ncbi:unnamed protein product, partial [Ectocarpus sp. 8 AP-2014]